MNPSLYIMCGLPCSGKSTFARTISNFRILSSDDYIEQRAKELQKTYNEIFDETIQRANQAFFQEVFHEAKLKNNIIIDRTNLSKSTRLKFIKIFENHEPVIFSEPTEDSRVFTASVYERSSVDILLIIIFFI